MVKRSILLVCAAMTLGAVSVPAVLADTIIPAIQSCRTDVLNAATNRHDTSKLSVRSDASSAKSWIKFDLGGLDVSALKTATLTVTLVEDKSSDRNFDVSYVNDNCVDNIGWAERDLTWNNAPGNNTTDFRGPDPSKTTLITTVSFNGGVAGQAFTIDVLKALATDTDGIVQFVLHNANVLMNFATHDHATEAWRPFLTVTLGAAGQARDPDPADGATAVYFQPVLGWTPGKFAATHDVYFGTSFDDVNSAGRANPLKVLVSQGQDPNTYTPAGPLDFGRVYYWRVDEVNAAPDSTIRRGLVWSFTTEAVADPIANVTATASSTYAGTSAANTANGSGVTGDLHGTDTATMWTAAQNGPLPAWIRYDFDHAYKLQEMWFWNYNDDMESLLGLGIKSAVIEYSTEGTTWKTLGTFEFPQAAGAVGHAHDATVSFGGVTAQAVRITISSSYGAVVSGLSEVRFYAIPTQARKPAPAGGAQDVSIDPTLTWWPGREAVSHQVYLGTDPNALTLADAVADAGYAATLNLGTTYYWRVDEVNQAAAVTLWTGSVWSFTTTDHVTLEDMESYNDTTDPVYEIWADGYDSSTNGSRVGYIDSANGTYNATTIRHGGRQSMPLAFGANGLTNSEAVRTFAPAQDWTRAGIKTLTLFFYGQTTNPTTVPFWVKLTDQSGKSAQVTYGAAAGENVANLAVAAWTQWNIPLSSFSGVTLSKIKSVTLGFGPAAGAGQVFIDDLQLAAAP